MKHLRGCSITNYKALVTFGKLTYDIKGLMRVTTIDTTKR